MQFFSKNVDNEQKDNKKIRFNKRINYYYLLKY